MDYFTIEWVSVVLISSLAIISPGPDFAMVSKIAVSKGRPAGVWCAVGIGMGVTVHLTYTLLGFGLLLSQQVWLLNTLKIIGASYLIWLGLQAFWPDIKARFFPSPTIEQAVKPKPRWMQLSQSPFFTGFLCNALNPKTMLFIVALYSQMVSPDTSIAIELSYGAFIATAHVVWFALIASLFTGGHFKQHLARFKRIIECCCGSVMILFGVKMLA
ncbi:LysE family translocator [Marinomonas ostreistagni]|uniref:LysE family translocator n=1 Tax=Marinomonas ostreistagni TaxID=359209 RepID=A0ABS0ZA64_9GAMM|nr:LysE family translocator [Marinomonas ostreistagni]MBJ7550545.1 LysE family translocator [Marinomonas ostreistagni]